MKRAGLLVTMTVVVLLAGCTTTKLLDFTLLSNRSIRLTDGGLLTVGPQRVSGQDEMFMVFIVPIGRLDIGNAVSRAIASDPRCVALQDGTIRLEQRIFFPLIYGDSRIVVEGFPIIESTAASSATP